MDKELPGNPDDIRREVPEKWRGMGENTNIPPQTPSNDAMPTPEANPQNDQLPEIPDVDTELDSPETPNADDRGFATLGVFEHENQPAPESEPETKSAFESEANPESEGSDHEKLVIEPIEWQTEKNGRWETYTADISSSDGEFLGHPIVSVKNGKIGDIEFYTSESGQAADQVYSALEAKLAEFRGLERYKGVFEDAHRLSELEEKMQHNEAFDAQDIDFIFRHEPKDFDYGDSATIRTDRLKEIDRIFDNGTDPSLIVNDDILARLSYEEQAKYLDTLTDHGANLDAQKIARELDPVSQLRYFDTLVQHGADLDIQDVVAHLSDDAIAFHAKEIMERGVTLDLPSLIKELDGNQLDFSTNNLLDAGVDPNLIAQNLDPEGLATWGKELIQAGADPRLVSDRLSPAERLYNSEALRSAGLNLNPREIVRSMTPAEQLEEFEGITSMGVSLDIDQIASKLSPLEKIKYLDKLTQNGAHLDGIYSVIAGLFGNS